MTSALPTAAPVAIRPMRKPARFLDLQRAFYRGDPHYVPPMNAGEAWQIDPRKNPWFEHGEAELLVAWRGDRPVGRISAARDRLDDEFHGTRVGVFGHFEAVDEEVAAALLRAAGDWCKARGATELRGPIDLSTNYRCGLLVEGEPGPPKLMMPYNPPVYADWIERAGFGRAKDLVALFVRSSELDLPRVRRIGERMRARARATLRRIDLRRLQRELAVLWDLYHRIWERNWGFVPMSEAEFRAQAKDLVRVAHPALLQMAEIDGAPVGFIVGLPDVNEPIVACNGRLFPFGWWKFLRRLKQVSTMRVITLGVVPEYRKAGIESMLMHAVIEDGMQNGFHACEASWILEDNQDMLGPLHAFGFRTYRRYRIYDRPLA